MGRAEVMPWLPVLDFPRFRWGEGGLVPRALPDSNSITTVFSLTETTFPCTPPMVDLVAFFHRIAVRLGFFLALHLRPNHEEVHDAKHAG